MSGLSVDLPSLGAGERDSRVPASYAMRVSLFFGAVCLVFGVHMPYLSVWLDWKGLSPQEIALVTGTPPFLRIVFAPLLAHMADRFAAHRTIIIVLAWCSLAAALTLSQASGFWALLGVAVVYALSVTTTIPLVETIAVEGVRRSGLAYGRMRLWGSLTFILASFAGGAILDLAGAGAGVWLIVVATLATALAAHALPVALPRLSSPDTPSPSSPGVQTILRLLRTPVFALFLIATGAVTGSHALFYSLGVLHWTKQGLSSGWCGALWAVSIVAEILLFAYSIRIVRWCGAVPLLIGGATVAVLRWTVMAFDPPLLILIPLQITHAMTYGGLHLGAIHFLARAVPESLAGTTQALYASIAAGLALGSATFVAGMVYESWGGATYALMAAMAAAGLAAALVLQRTWDGGVLWADDLPRLTPTSASQAG